MRQSRLEALLSLALKPKAPPRALRKSVLAGLAHPPLELRRSEGLVRLESGVITTAKGASAEVRIRGEALVAVKGNSIATLRRGLQGLELLIEKGGALVNVAAGVPFRCALPLGRVQVRGTWFYLESRGPRESYVCLCEGRLGLRTAGLKRELVSEDHLAVTLTRNNGSAGLKPAETDHWHPDTGDLD